MECSARAGENADSIFKIIDSQKKPMYLPEKGEAESRKKTSEDGVEFATRDVRFCHGDRVRNKLIIQDVLQGNCQTYKKRVSLQKEKNGHMV